MCLGKMAPVKTRPVSHGPALVKPCRKVKRVAPCGAKRIGCGAQNLGTSLSLPPGGDMDRPLYFLAVYGEIGLEGCQHCQHCTPGFPTLPSCHCHGVSWYKRNQIPSRGQPAWPLSWVSLPTVVPVSSCTGTWTRIGPILSSLPIN